MSRFDNFVILTIRPDLRVDQEMSQSQITARHIGQDKDPPKIAFISLPINLNTCFGCSKEPSHWDGSFEYPQHMFWFRNKKKSNMHSFLEACRHHTIDITTQSSHTHKHVQTKGEAAQSGHYRSVCETPSEWWRFASWPKVAQDGMNFHLKRNLTEWKKDFLVWRSILAVELLVEVNGILQFVH